MFDEILKYFTGKNIITHSIITSSFLITSSASYELKYLPQVQKCKKHWEYHGLTPPINNCNVCWEYYSQKSKR